MTCIHFSHVCVQHMHIGTVCLLSPRNCLVSFDFPTAIHIKMLNIDHLQSYYQKKCSSS